MTQPPRPSLPHRPELPGQVVLVLQGGGALGAYQGGVYQALHEAGIEPDWVIGTSIGAINAALIARNPPADRLTRLRAFWDRVTQPEALPWLTQASTLARGIPGFFTPSPSAWLPPQTPVGVEAASYYRTDALRETLAELVDFDLPDPPRLTVGAVRVAAGTMRYFDSRDEALDVRHILASGALPPAFAAVTIDGEAYWDGGLYSNTPLEAVLDDRRRRSSLIFAVNVWQPSAPEPASINEVLSRQKDIQFASRADSHVQRQAQIHQLRHVVRELYEALPAAAQADPRLRELAGWGCGTTMHLLRLQCPPLPGEDQSKDIDFSAEGVRARWAAGHRDTLKAISDRPWLKPHSPRQGLHLHHA